VAVGSTLEDIKGGSYRLGRCFGITRNVRRCGRFGGWRFFCDDHRFQPLIWLSFLIFTVVAGTASIYSGFFTSKLETPPLSQPQLQALTKLDELLNAPDEAALRGKFGFSEMVYANIRITKSGLSLKRGYTNADRQWTTDYVHSHEVLWELGPTMKVEKDSEGRVQIIGDGKTLSQVVLPHIYSDNFRTLEAYSSSSLVPNNVAAKIKELVHIIQGNANLLINVLQEVYKTNPQLFLEHDDPNSPNFHLIDNKYWSKFTNIKPFAEGISLEIRKIRESKDKVSKTNSGSGPPMESHQTSDTVTAIVRPPTVVDWHDKQNWQRYLRTAMTRTDVRQVFWGADENVRVRRNPNVGLRLRAKFRSYHFLCSERDARWRPIFVE